MTVKRNQRPPTLTLTGRRRNGQYHAVALGKDAWLTETSFEMLLAFVRASLSAGDPCVRFPRMAVGRLRRALGGKKPWRLILWVNSDEYRLAPGTELVIDPSFRKLSLKDPLLKRSKTALLRGVASRRKKMNKH
jgi:hypothetical protein